MTCVTDELIDVTDAILFYQAVLPVLRALGSNCLLKVGGFGVKKKKEVFTGTSISNKT